VVLVVVADEVGIYLRVEILCGMSVIYSSSKVATRYCSNSRGGGFKIVANGGSDGEGD